MNSQLIISEIWDQKWGRLDVARFKDAAFRDDLWTLYHRPLIEKYLKRMGSDSIFLEAGCGMGQWCFYAAEKYKIRSIGVDIAEATIKKLNDYCDKSDNDLVSFIVDDLNYSRIESCFCDIFISLGVVEHFKDSSKMMRNLFRLLKPNGLGIITVPNIFSLHTITRPFLQFFNKWDIFNKWNIGYEKSFSPKQLKRLSLGVGFKIVECGILPSGEIFGSFINGLPFLGNIFKKLGLLIENKQNVFGFILFIVVQK